MYFVCARLYSFLDLRSFISHFAFRPVAVLTYFAALCGALVQKKTDRRQYLNIMGDSRNSVAIKFSSNRRAPNLVDLYRVDRYIDAVAFVKSPRAKSRRSAAEHPQGDV